MENTEKKSKKIMNIKKYINSSSLMLGGLILCFLMISIVPFALGTSNEIRVHSNVVAQKTIDANKKQKYDFSKIDTSNQKIIVKNQKIDLINLSTNSKIIKKNTDKNQTYLKYSFSDTNNTFKSEELNKKFREYMNKLTKSNNSLFTNVTNNFEFSINLTDFFNQQPVIKNIDDFNILLDHFNFSSTYGNIEEFQYIQSFETFHYKEYFKQLTTFLKSKSINFKEWKVNKIEFKYILLIENKILKHLITEPIIEFIKI
ncbi:hypothetical protein [Mycoplasma phocoenae]|uniref:Uncharacterized protein n=1 Tax=Mycoplasma phocoenae TaxID=754517 RepID=A0A858U918_9MOLU|nr:hypothetical protein [Mycoplasma phocoenae]QJG67208.1 hypothetical protein HGG69_02750 [Mycoplasma phocoenae]